MKRIYARAVFLRASVIDVYKYCDCLLYNHRQRMLILVDSGLHETR